jgi:hypothetical protein
MIDSNAMCYKNSLLEQECYFGNIKLIGNNMNLYPNHHPFNFKFYLFLLLGVRVIINKCTSHKLNYFETNMAYVMTLMRKAAVTIKSKDSRNLNINI